MKFTRKFVRLFCFKLGLHYNVCMNICTCRIGSDVEGRWC